MARGTFNSLSRDHPTVSRLRGWETARASFQLPLSGSPTTIENLSSTPTFQLPLSGSLRQVAVLPGRPPVGEHFQLPLSGSREAERILYGELWCHTFNSLSRDHEGLRQGQEGGPQGPFNSLSRDHEVVELCGPCGGVADFQLPLSGSHSWILQYPPKGFIFFQLPLSGSLEEQQPGIIDRSLRSRRQLSTPSLGITPEVPLHDGVQEDGDLSTPSLGITGLGICFLGPLVLFQLSTPSLGITSRSCWSTPGGYRR